MYDLRMFVFTRGSEISGCGACDVRLASAENSSSFASVSLPYEADITINKPPSPAVLVGKSLVGAVRPTAIRSKFTSLGISDAFLSFPPGESDKNDDKAFSALARELINGEMRVWCDELSIRRLTVSGAGVIIRAFSPFVPIAEKLRAFGDFRDSEKLLDICPAAFSMSLPYDGRPSRLSAETIDKHRDKVFLNYGHLLKQFAYTENGTHRIAMFDDRETIAKKLSFAEKNRFFGCVSAYSAFMEYVV